MPQIVGYGIPVDTHTFTKRDLVEVGYSFSAQGFSISSTQNYINTRSVGFWISTYTNQAIRTRGYFALGGLTARQISEDYITNLVDTPGGVKGNKPGYCLLFSGGTEALTQGTSASLAEAIRWTRRSIKSLVENGIVVIVPTIWGGVNVLSDDIRGWCVDFNEWLQEVAYNNSDVVLLDYAGTIVDPDSATGDHLTGYLQTDDTHPASLGVQTIAKNLTDSLNIYLPESMTVHQDDGFGTYKNLIANPNFTGTGGTTVAPATGDTATSWVSSVSSATLAVSKQSGSDGKGDWQRLAVTAGANSGLAALTQTVSSNIPTGETCFLQSEINTSSFTKINSVYIEAKCKNGGGSTLFTARAGDGQDNNINSFNGIMRTLDFTVPSDTATIDITIAVLCDSDAGGSGAATVDVRRTVLRQKYLDNISL